MVIQLAAVMPHGFELIEELYNLTESWKDLAERCHDVAVNIVDLDPDIIIVASPHNLRIEEHIGIIYTEWLKGQLTNEDETKRVELKCKCDRDFAKRLYERSKSIQLPVTLVNFGALEGPLSYLPLDWGTFIPLWFINKEYIKHNKVLAPIVLVTPSRKIEWEKLVKFGKEISNLSDIENKKAVFIASADQGHAHLETGPYGFDPAAREFDEKICELINANNLAKLLDFSEEFIERAKPDSLWQMLILQGILEENTLQPKFCYYACPTYYGMLVALFEKE